MCGATTGGCPYGNPGGYFGGHDENNGFGGGEFARWCSVPIGQKRKMKWEKFKTLINQALPIALPKIYVNIYDSGKLVKQ
jgi:hypothetical protein